MKKEFIKPLGMYAEDGEIGQVHLVGAIDTTACGIANEDWEGKFTRKPLTCITCITYLQWAKDVAKHVKI